MGRFADKGSDHDPAAWQRKHAQLLSSVLFLGIFGIPNGHHFFQDLASSELKWLKYVANA